MLKVERSIGYLKKEKNNTEVPKVLEEVQHIEQAQRFSELKRYRRFDSDDEREKNTELFSAIRNGNLQKVQELLKAGVKVNIIDKNNKDNTPLHYAVERDKKEIVEKLLQEWKADINAKNNRDDTPLHIAVSKGKKELVLLLLNKNAEVNVENKDGKTPLDIAKSSTYQNKEEIIKVLEKHLRNITKSSGQAGTLLTQEKEVHNKLRKFVEDFVFIYERSLSEYYERLERQVAKSGKWASFVNEVIEVGKSGTEGIETAKAKAPSMVGINILHKAISSIGSKHNREELKKLIDQLYTFKKDLGKVREELVKSGVEVFQNFESQFVQVTADGSWERAMEKLAYDAVNRIINYFKKNTEEGFSTSSITKGIIFGESKKYKHTSTGIPHVRPGHTLEGKNSNLWNTAELFDTGLVTVKTDGTADKYYKKKGGKSDASKYGYRLLFKWESEDRVGLAKKLNVEYREARPTREGYKYILKSDEKTKEKWEGELLDEINNKDSELVEERLLGNFKKEMGQIKQEAEDNFNKLEGFIGKNFKELLDYIKNNQSEVKNELMRQHQEASQQREEIARDNKDEHKKTQAGVENANQGINNLQKGQEVIINEIRTLGKKDQDKKPVWFDVRESVMSFSGREEQLDEIANHIKQRIVVISGLGGVGKSELAIKYARSHHGKEDSVIWINAETHETAKDSFRRLLKELDLKTRDQDGDEKSVGLMAKEVYNFFAGKESLFIFDNVKEHSIIKEFLPSGTSGCHVLITSQNLQLFNEQEHGKIERLNLDTLPEDKATEFVKKALNINNTLQDKEIKELVETLGYLPLALQHVVAYIKESGYVDSIGKCVEVYKRSEQEIQSFLNRGGLSSYDKTIFLTFKTTIDKVKQEENGKLAEEILNTIAYFASDNIPKGTFLKLAQGRVEESDASIKTDRANGMLTRAINLLGKYSIINLKEEQVSIHRLVQKVIRSELKKQSEEGKVLEEEVLGKALGLLREYMVNRDSAENYIPHVISVWNYANEYDKLIEDFIVNNIGGREAYTTHFHSVTGSGSYEVVEDIINKIDSSKLKEVINAKDKERRIPLHNAALSGEEQIVRLLIEKGANVNAKKKHEWTPLHLAAKNGLLGVVNVLLEKRANVNDKTGYKFTPLHLAAKNGYPEVVKLILDKGANINAEDRHKYTPLHFAVKNDHFKVVQILLKDDKIDVNVETEYKLTPLHFAAKNGNLDIVEALLEKGANVNVKNTDNFTPLHLAAVSNHIEIVNGLLKKGEIDVNAQTTKGNTPLHLAAEKGNLEVIKALIARNADVDVKNEEGKVASDLANEKDHLEVKNYIIQHQNKREVPISQVEQITYKRRPGTSGMGGQLYEIELLMLFLLQGITQKEDKKIDSFYLATNMEEAGDFDDVVFKYRYNENGAEKSKIVFLQAKHKETEKNEKETKAKEKKITIDTLLSKSEKGDFLLRKYLSTYRKIKQLRLKEDHLIFKDGIESCDFVIYTNAVFNFDKSKDSVEKAYVEPGDILNLKGKSQEYYKLNADEKVMDALRHSLDYEILVRELAQSVSSGSIDGNKSIFKDYQVSLAERVIEKKNQREGKLREEFLNGEQEFSSAFFEEIKKKKEFAKKSVDELKEELRKKNIQLPNNFGSAEENDLKLPFPSKLFSDEEIEEFLSELKLFVSQPNEGQLGEIIKQKIQSIYKVEQNDIDTVFSDVEYKVRKWWREGDGYITESNKFFQESARVSINFDVKEPVTLFTGRIRELEDLHKILQEGGEAVISQMASVTGLGGIGKSELARKYISEHNKDYDNNVIWINADNYLTIAESFRRLAQDKLRISTTDENGKEKEIKLIVEDVYRFFTKRHRNSLFVFDNAGKHKAVREGEEAEGIDKFLPSGPNKPHVLITSRDQEWGEIKSLPLGVFTEEEAIELIEKALKDIVALEENEVKRLAKELQYLPLALRQAVAYIKVENQGLNKWEGGKFTIGSYLEQFKEKANELLSRESSETHDRYTGTVMTTWQITIDKIKQKKVRGGKQALEILDVMAYLAPDKIPVDEIFSKLIGDEEVRHSAVELLDQYSMANLDGGKLNIHRLVQQVTRIELEEKGKNEKVVERTFELLGESFPYGKNMLKDCLKKRELLPHLEVFLSHIDNWIVKKPKNKEKLEKGYLESLLQWMNDGYFDLSNPRRTKKLLERALAIQEEHYGAENVKVVVTLENLGNAYGALGDHKKKKELLERALEIKKKSYGPGHFEVAKILVNLASAYGALGDHKKKKELLERALEIGGEHYGLGHSEVAVALVHLGSAYGDLGDPRKQKELTERALAIQEKHYGAEHFEVARTLVSLGNVYGDLGDDPRKQKELLERALPILEKHYGTEHFEVAGTLVNLSNAYYALRDPKKQKELLERALPILEKHYGIEYFEVARILANLGLAYGDLGDHKKKKELLEKVLKAEEKYYGLEHFEVARTLVNLGDAYGDLGDHKKKKELLERALEIKKKSYGLEHFEVAGTLANLGLAYGALGDHKKQEELIERASHIFEKYKHPDFIKLRRTLDQLRSLHFAARNGNLGLIKTLIEEGADVLARDNHDTVLHQTVSSNNEEVIKFVLDKIKEKDPQNFSEHINAKDTEGDTPLMWAAENGKTNAAKILLEYGADLNAQNNGGETALHWAVKGSYQEIVRLLLDKQADPNIQDNNGKTPLDLVQEKLAQDPENDDFETITGLLLSVTDESKSQHQEEQVSGSLSLEECLPAGNRGKREAKVGECLFTWEDVDEFNEEKDEKRDFSKIKIDGERFVSYIKDLPEEKQSQLIQLADKVKVIGESQSLVNKLISNQKVINHLNRVGKISGMTMHGMMAKNVLADFLNGDYQGVAVNVGFIAGGQGFAKVAEAASIKGLKLASGGKLLLGKSLRAASPFLARGTSAFVIYDLVNQVKAFKNGTEEALVGIVGDSIYLGVDSAEIGIEVAEAFEVLEGVSSVTGPIGAAIGTVVFVGTDIYMAVKRVDKIDQIIHLKGNERFIEGLRAFIGMQPENYIEELVEEKQLNDQLVKQGLEYLKQHSDIQKYVFPTGKSVVDSCHTKFEMRHGVLIPTEELIPYEVPLKECTTKFEVDLDNTVLLERKRTDIKWSREKPDNPDGGQVFCLPQGDYEPAPNYGSYLCESAIGVTDLSANKTGGYTLINLGEGTDNVKGFTDSRNIFVVNNGSKEYYGGNKDDIFVLQAGYVRGYLSGEGGINTLDTTSFAFQEEPLTIQLDIGEIVDYSRDNWLRVCDMNKVIGRENRAETITVSCNGCNSNVKLIDGQSGNKEIKDKINIVDNHCSYQMQVIVRPNTVIYNRALEGNFDYLVPLNEGGSTEFIFIFGPERFNVNNTFWFEYEPVDIKSVNVRYVNIFNRTGHEVKFNFIKFDKEFNVTISYPENPFYRLGSSGEIRIGNKDNLYMLQSSNESAEEIIKNYVALANRLNKMSFFIQSKLNNETVVIGSGNYEVIHNNPIHKSHLVGNGGENVYVIDSGDEKLEVAMPEVVIYDLDVESSVDTIDLRNLVRQVRGKLSNQDNFQLKVLKSANDLLLKATVVEVKPTEDSSVSKMRKHEYCTVRLKDGVNWYNKTHVIVDNAPMKINLDNNEWSLKPLPLKFEKDKEVIIVTSQDIEENTELITPKRAGNYSFVSDHGSDLIVTNAFDVNVAKNDLCTIVLSKFYEKPKMATLSIKFADKEIILKEHQEEIGAARDVNIVKKEHKDQVYNDVFNHTKSSPEVIMLSDQPVTHRHRHSRHTRHRRSTTSSSTRPTAWINDLFGWVRSSVSGLLSSKPESTPSSISQVDARVDVNGTIMLLDVLVRKFTGKQYIFAVDQSIPLLEARSYALNITNRFEELLNKTAIKSGISLTNLNFDPVVVQSAIIGKIINGRFSEIAKTLYSFAKEACPEFKQTDKFLDHLKSSLKEEKETVMLQQKVEKPSKDLSQEVSRKVELSKKPNTFLNGTSVVRGISRGIN